MEQKTPLRTVKGSLLEAKDDYIAHQCNCITTDAAGLAKLVFEKYPYANTYLKRQGGRRDNPGTIQICGPVAAGDGPVVINMLAQKYPGKTDYPTSARLVWFQSCLKQMAQLPGCKSIGFPFGIGCNMAGGDWPSYHEMLLRFAQDNPHIQVTLYDNK